MKKITFFILLLVVCACKNEDSKTSTTVPEPKKIEIDQTIYSSAAVEQYIKFNTEFSEYELVKLKNPIAFTTLEIDQPVKENEFEFNKTRDFKYYTPFTFAFEKIDYKIIAYQSYGENDSKVLNIQLNSYQNGQQIDALLLDCRFVFETEYYRNFRIKQDGSIAINKLAVNGLNYDSDGDIVGTKSVKDTTKENVSYKMTSKGTFTKM